MSAPQAGDALPSLALCTVYGSSNWLTRRASSGKLMADLGADVIKIEPPGGQYTRLVGPFLDDIPHRERSLFFWHYNTSKRASRSIWSIRTARPCCGVSCPPRIFCSRPIPGYLPALGLGDVLSSLNPRLIMCSLTPWADRPWRHFLSADLLQLAAGGQMSCCGYPQDVPDAPPIAPGRQCLAHRQPFCLYGHPGGSVLPRYDWRGPVPMPRSMKPVP